jgi:hypothetical protein
MEGREGGATPYTVNLMKRNRIRIGGFSWLLVLTIEIIKLNQQVHSQLWQSFKIPYNTADGFSIEYT